MIKNQSLRMLLESKNSASKDIKRGDVVFQSDSKLVSDNKDHFPINSKPQALNAIARVNQYKESPEWFNGSLTNLINKVIDAVHKKYPSIKISPESKIPGAAKNEGCKTSKSKKVNESIELNNNDYRNIITEIGREFGLRKILGKFTMSDIKYLVDIIKLEEVTGKERYDAIVEAGFAKDLYDAEYIEEYIEEIINKVRPGGFIEPENHKSKNHKFNKMRINEAIDGKGVDDILYVREILGDTVLLDAIIKYLDTNMLEEIVSIIISENDLDYENLDELNDDIDDEDLIDRSIEDLVGKTIITIDAIDYDDFDDNRDEYEGEKIISVEEYKHKYYVSTNSYDYVLTREEILNLNNFQEVYHNPTEDVEDSVVLVLEKK